MAKTTIAQLEQLVREQAAQIAALEERFAALETRPVASSAPTTRRAAIDQLGELPVLGKPGDRVHCGIDGHSTAGPVTLNRNGNCPKCACQAVKAMSMARYTSRAADRPQQVVTA